MPAPRVAPREALGRWLPGARVWLKGGGGGKVQPPCWHRADMQQLCFTWLYSQRNEQSRGTVFCLFVFNPSPSPYPQQLATPNGNKYAVAGRGLLPAGRNHNPPRHHPPPAGKGETEPGGHHSSPPELAGGQTPKSTAPQKGRGGPTGWGSRVEAELGGCRWYQGGLSPDGGGHSCPWSSSERSRRAPRFWGAAPSSPSSRLRARRVLQPQALLAGKSRLCPGRGEDDGGRAALTPHPPA